DHRADADPPHVREARRHGAPALHPAGARQLAARRQPHASLPAGERRLRVRLPARVTVVRRSTTSTAQTLGWTVAAGSLLRLHQLLAQEAYLPVVWNAAGADVSRTPAAEVAAAIDPPAGSFAWRFPNTPPQLARQWNPNEVTQITRGAVMM